MLLWNAVLKPVAGVLKEDSPKTVLFLKNTQSSSFRIPDTGNAQSKM